MMTVASSATKFPTFAPIVLEPPRETRPLAGLDVLCLANDWAAPPTSKHHLMKRVAATNRVLWAEGAGMRVPDLSRATDRRRLFQKAKSFVAAPRRVLPNLAVYSPPSLPFPGSGLARAVNRRLYQATLARALRLLDMSTRPLIWSFAPHVAPLLRDVGRSLLVYHCVDRWSKFDDYDAALMDRLEAELARSADVVFASAGDLVDHCRQYNPNTHYLPHGVDFAHFARALVPGPLPEDLAAIPGPRIGFFGLIHEWVDIELIAELARRLPFSFVLIGDAKTKLEPLAGIPNVFHLGARPYASLADYCRGFSAAIVPFRRTELTQNVNPIKLREYAAAGLPVVSTGLPEVRRCADIAYCADRADEWEDALLRAVAVGARAEERAAQSARVAGQDWSAVLATASQIVRESLEAR